MTLCVMLGLTGCGNGKPSDVTDDNYEIACKVLDTVDSFLDGDMNYEVASDKLYVLKERFDTDDDPVGGTLSASAVIMAFRILKTNSGASDIKEVEEERDDFAKRIGK